MNCTERKGSFVRARSLLPGLAVGMLTALTSLLRADRTRFPRLDTVAISGPEFVNIPLNKAP